MGCTRAATASGGGSSKATQKRQECKREFRKTSVNSTEKFLSSNIFSEITFLTPGWTEMYLNLFQLLQGGTFISETLSDLDSAREHTTISSKLDLFNRWQINSPLGYQDILSRFASGLTPWCIRFCDVLLCLCGKFPLFLSEISESLLGCLVGLAGQSTDSSDEVVGDCLCVGLIRGIDNWSKKLYILTSLSPTVLVRVKYLIISRSNSPVVLKSPRVTNSKSPFSCNNGLLVNGTGSRVMHSRSNLLRNANAP